MALNLVLIKNGMKDLKSTRKILFRIHPCFCQSSSWFSSEKQIASSQIYQVPASESSPSSGSADKAIAYSFQPETKKWTKVRSGPVIISSAKDGDDRKDTKQSLEMVSLQESIYGYTLKHLLPNGYPNSVHAGYTKYTYFSFVGNVASTTTMVLSTQTLLLAIGVGQHAAAPISATLNWILKDGIGQFGGILFASRISASSNSVDADPKRWRMVSSLAMDCAMMLELATPSFPGYFLFIASVANIGKNIAFLTASASRAKLHQCLARNENLADVTAKSGSQSILASLVGTGLGIGLSPYLLGDLTSVIMGCFALSAVNQFCTYQSLRQVPIDRLNRQRMMILLELYFKRLHSSSQREGRSVVTVSPKEVCKHESFLPLVSKDTSQSWFQVGQGIETLAPTGPEELRSLHHVCSGEKYLLNCDIEENDPNGRGIKSTSVTFLEGAKDEDILRASFHANALKAFADYQIDLDFDTNCELSKQNISLVNASHEYMKRHITSFKNELNETGWKFDDGVSIVLESEKDVRIRLS